ncbi:hypothetical protein ES705_11829 [subsurface metagenome]
MREINYVYHLTPNMQDRLRVSAHIEGKIVVKFLVQYEAFIKQKWCPIVRYDTSHGFAHKDILHPDGSVEKQPLLFYNFNLALTFAIQDLKLLWKWYRSSYEQEKNL